MLPRLISTIFTYLNAGGYYKTATEIQNAINTAQIQLYKKLRGNMAEYGPSRPKAQINFQETSTTADALSELYRVYDLPYDGTGIATIFSTDNRNVDIVQIIEICYDKKEVYYPVNIVPDNQYLLMKQNEVLYPLNGTSVMQRPLGRMLGFLQYEIFPSVYFAAKARVLTLPTNVEFELIDNDITPIPDLVPNYIDTDFTEDKFNNLLFLTLNSLGFNISNGLLVQGTAQKEFKEL